MNQKIFNNLSLKALASLVSSTVMVFALFSSLAYALDTEEAPQQQKPWLYFGQVYEHTRTDKFHYVSILMEPDFNQPVLKVQSEVIVAEGKLDFRPGSYSLVRSTGTFELIEGTRVYRRVSGTPQLEVLTNKNFDSKKINKFDYYTLFFDELDLTELTSDSNMRLKFKNREKVFLMGFRGRFNRQTGEFIQPETSKKYSSYTHKSSDWIKQQEKDVKVIASKAKSFIAHYKAKQADKLASMPVQKFDATQEVKYKGKEVKYIARFSAEGKLVKGSTIKYYMENERYKNIAPAKRSLTYKLLENFQRDTLIAIEYLPESADLEEIQQSMGLRFHSIAEAKYISVSTKNVFIDNIWIDRDEVTVFNENREPIMTIGGANSLY